MEGPSESQKRQEGGGRSLGPWQGDDGPHLERLPCPKRGSGLPHLHKWLLNGLLDRN